MTNGEVTPTELREVAARVAALAADINDARVRLAAAPDEPTQRAGARLHSGGNSWCREDGCARKWTYDRGGLPCTEPAEYDVRDANGGGGQMCAGHTPRLPQTARPRHDYATDRPTPLIGHRQLPE